MAGAPQPDQGFPCFLLPPECVKNPLRRGHHSTINTHVIQHKDASDENNLCASSQAGDSTTEASPIIWTKKHINKTQRKINAYRTGDRIANPCIIQRTLASPGFHLDFAHQADKFPHLDDEEGWRSKTAPPPWKQPAQNINQQHLFVNI